MIYVVFPLHSAARGGWYAGVLDSDLNPVAATEGSPSKGDAIKEGLRLAGLGPTSTEVADGKDQRFHNRKAG